MVILKGRCNGERIGFGVVRSRVRGCDVRKCGEDLRRMR